MASSSLSISRWQMVSWRLACCWARPARGFSCWGPFSFFAAGALCLSASSRAFSSRYWVKPMG